MPARCLSALGAGAAAKLVRRSLPQRRGYVRLTDAQGAQLIKTIVAIRTQGWGYGLGIGTMRTSASEEGMMVTKQEIPASSEVVDEEPCKIQQALRDGNLSFGFSAGGLLFPYYIGTIFALEELGIVNERTKLGGASAGSLIAGCFHSGMSRDQVLEDCLRLAHDLRANGTRGRLGPALRRILEDSLPEDCHERCSGSSYIAVTRAFPTPTGLLLSQYHSKSDLVQAMLTSCHIPWWMDNKVMIRFRGELHYDGGLTQFIPIPPATEGVRVCVFPSAQLSSVSNIAISPDSFGAWRHDLNQMLSWAFEPAPEETLLHLVDRGAEDARAWADKFRLQEVMRDMRGEQQQQQQGAGRALDWGREQGRQKEEDAQQTGLARASSSFADAGAGMQQQQGMGA